MTPKQRLLAVLEGNPPDKIPLYLDGWFQPGIHFRLVKDFKCTSKTNLLAWLLLRGCTRPLSAPTRQLLMHSFIGLYDSHFLAVKLGTDALSFWLPAVANVSIDLRRGTFTDYYGARHVMKDFVDQRDESFRVLRSKEDLERFQRPRFHSPLSKILVSPFLRKFKDHASIAWVGGPWETAHALYPLTELLMDIYRDKPFVEKLLDLSVEIWVEAIEEAAELGMDGVIIGDDCGTQTGPMISPKHHSELVIPRLRKLVQEARRRGLYVILHSCGNIEPLLESIAECGFHAVHPLQPGAMNTLEVARKYKGKFAICTGFDVQRQHALKPEEVEQQVKELIEAASPHLILAPTNAITNETPPENLFAFLHAREKFGVLG
ncbi:MAG: uroporphyrinogen decarboxylase family protein [Candidatus Hadarchaeales archaeon]